MSTPPNPIPVDAATAAAAFRRPHDHLAVEGGRLAYWRFGRGPDVFCVHGWPLHAATFRALVPLLARTHTLHLIDLPGTGQTEWHGPIDLVSHARTVRRAIDAIGLGPYAMLAHDSGATIARLAAAGDQRVQAIVMGNTELPGHHPFLLKLYVWAARHPRAAKLMFAGMRLGPVRRSRLGFGGCFTDPAFVDGEFGRWFVEPLLNDPKVAAGQMTLARNLDFSVVDGLADVHARIAAPVLCIWGPRDPFFPVARARAMLPEFPGGAELVEIPRGKLFVHEDRAEEFADHTLRFFARTLAGIERAA
jgi:pimeloyl-ACP methyl ester carboxylesterase